MSLVTPALLSAITQGNLNKNYLTSSFGPRHDVVKNESLISEN